MELNWKIQLTFIHQMLWIDVNGILVLKKTHFSSFLSNVWLLSVLWLLLSLNIPMLHQRLLVYISYSSRFQRRYVSLRPYRKNCMCTCRAVKFQSSSPFFSMMHHNEYRIFQRFRPSLYALPEIAQKYFLGCYYYNLIN